MLGVGVLVLGFEFEYPALFRIADNSPAVLECLSLFSAPVSEFTKPFTLDF